jgi:hypothetical protein
MNMLDEPRKIPTEPCDPNDHPERDEKLDEAVADSMIASDPPASVSKGQPTAPPRRPKPSEAGQKDASAKNPGHPSAGSGRS